MTLIARIWKPVALVLVSCLVIGLASVSGRAAEAAATSPPKLVIVKAVYGDLPDGDSTDVTQKVAAMVKDNALSVDATNDNFGDPAEGIVKKLRVDYTIDGVAQSKTVDENATLTISAGDKPPAGKLVIVKAVYGDLPDGDSTDVTQKVAAMVKDNALSVDATNDNFGDPAENIVKKLRVDYTIDGVAQSKTVDENATLSISAGDKPPAGKLVIVKAVYGDLPSGDSTDVTQKVAAMVKDNALSVDATNDNFGDPAEGIVKKLRVDYTFEGAAKSKTVDENETLTISATGE
jgi:uncharacterized protein YbaA (DUF1428 family)